MLLAPREELLSELGVSWSLSRSTHEAHWDACFGQLMDFRRREGHCMVRRGFKHCRVECSVSANPWTYGGARASASCTQDEAVISQDVNLEI